MKRTHLSLYYLAGYLLPAGIALMAAPEFSLNLLFSTGEYGTVIPRLAGVLILGLEIIVVQIIRLRVAVLYPTTLFVRTVFLASFVWLYGLSGDPLFLTLLGIVGFGVLLTLFSFIKDRRASPEAR
ncbi:MAG: hypothetical protein ACRDGA_11815 [Bacteroidota bacterium]